MSKFTLLSAFEMEGHWWLPERKDSQVSGKLVFVLGDKLRLTTKGRLDGLPLYAPNPSTCPIIDGLSDGGDTVTLLAGRGVGFSGNFRGSGTLTYDIWHAVIGPFFDNENDILARTADISLTGLVHWIGGSIFTNPMKRKEDGLMETTSIVFTYTRAFEITLTSRKIRVALDPTAHSHIAETHASIDCGVSLSVESETPLSMNDAIELSSHRMEPQDGTGTARWNRDVENGTENGTGT